MEKIHHANSNHKSAGVAILISGNKDFKIKMLIVTRKGISHNKGSFIRKIHIK